MGKLSLNKKKPPEDSNKQQKISAFFQTGNTEKRTKGEQSLLFQNVGDKKPVQSIERNTKNNCSVSSFHPLVDRRTNMAANDVGSSNINQSSSKNVIKTQFSATPVKQTFQYSAVNSESHQKTSLDESDCDIIPATPDTSSGQQATNKKRAYSRSFLSSTLSAKPPGTKTKSQLEMNKASTKQLHNNKNKTTSLSCKSKCQKISWNSNDETMSRVLTDIGVPEKAKSSLGLGHELIHKNVELLHENKLELSGTVNRVVQRVGYKSDSLILDKVQSNCQQFEPVKTGEKRQRPIDEADSPPCKKHASELPKTISVSKDKTILSKGTRGGLLLERSLQTPLHKQSESESDTGSDNEESAPKTTLKLFSKEPLQERDLDVKKFSWKSKTTVDVKGKQFIKPKSILNVDSLNAFQGSSSDNMLNDLLGELKDTKKSAVDSTNDEKVPSVKLKKKRSSVGITSTPKDSKFDKVNSSLLVNNDYESEKTYRLVDHTEADDALSDIMIELKETLTQQNKLSNEKSSTKKRKFQHKDHHPDLSISISRQLDFSEKANNKFNPVTPVKKVKEVTSKLVSDSEQQEESSQVSETMSCVDEHVKKSKACDSLFQEESWLEDMDLEALDITIESSPFKKQLNTKSDDMKYNPKNTRPPAEAFGRHVVHHIQHNGTEIILQVQSSGEGKEKTVVLQGFWIDTNIECGDIIHVLGEFDEYDTCYVTDKENFVVVNPDLLISGTSVVSTVYCMRKSVLNEKFKGTDGRNIHMLHGSIIHAFFQEVLLQCQSGQTDRHMQGIATDILKQPGFLHEMYAISATQDSVMEEITKLFPLVTKFVQNYLSGKNKINNRPANEIEILDIKDIEENIWSPRFGVKGKIDLTVEVKIHGDSRKGTPSTTKVMPLELKTGKPSFSIEHKGQVTIYSMMSSDRREDPQGGLLLYLRDPQMRTVPAHYSHKRGLIQLRNELAYYLKSSTKRNQNGDFGRLPTPINNERSCGKCPHLLNCTAYQAVVEKVEVGDNHAMKRLIPQSIGHLTQEHLEYFRLWCEMMHLEMAASRSIGISQLWCETAWVREDNGEAFCGMVLYPTECEKAKGEKFIQAFKRHFHSTIQTKFSGIGLTRGDSVVVSAENQPLISLCMGNIHSVNDNVIKLLVDRDLRKNLDYKDLVYRIDKCDTYNTMATNFTNVARLMENSEVGDKLRELIIECRPPQFEVTLSKSIIEKVKDLIKPLNKPQKTAILKVLMCKDYVLIKGYPGTGKTSTIVALVRILSKIGVSILLTSYTHSAVDNILLKLKQYDVKFLRMGRVERIHPEIQKYAAETLTKSCTTVQQLEEFYNSQQVVATTCLGTNHVLFSRRRFDLCIVDEASQVLQPACLGPLFCSSKFVLVGDPLQLPPVVQSVEAKNKGMAESLFARLDSTGGTYELNMQYRMNSEIVRLSNLLVYSGALMCGSIAVANGKLHYPMAVSQGLVAWVYRAIAVEDHVLFLNTEKVVSNMKQSSGVKNKTEVSIVKYLVEQFIHVGVSEKEVGVIAPYRQQVRLLHDIIHQDFDKVEVNTVDQYQGRDKEVIIISFVKQGQNIKPHAGEILQDLRRLNVALTRAKYKLIMIGHMPSLHNYEPIREILKVLRSNQIIELPSETLQQLT